jgi:uncharacterized membrane protein
MKKINLSLQNPKLDFTFKSYLLWFVIPYVTMFTIIIATMSGLDMAGWTNPDMGVFGLAMFGLYAGLIGVIIGHVIVPIVVLFGNKKFMSGAKVPKFNRFPRLTLFSLSFIAYLATMWLMVKLDLINVFIEARLR